MGESSLIKDLVFEINRIAQKLDKQPFEVRKTEFLSECDKFSNNDLRKVGGFSSIIKSYFAPQDKDLKTIQSNKNHTAYIQKLEKTIGDREAFQEKLVASVGEQARKMKIEVKNLNIKETEAYLDSLQLGKETDSVKEARSIVTIWSDQHYGTYVSKEELGGKNEFNWEIGSRRLGMLCEQIATYKIEKRHFHEELVILLLGDNIGGVIHNQEGPDFDLITHQICGTIAYYVSALNYLKAFFPKIKVVCQPGNHARVMHKVSKDRAIHQKYDSFENIIFYSLSQTFASDPKITFLVSKAPFSDVVIQGHRIYATHGDTVFTTGNVGKVVNTSRLEQQINAINAEELNQLKKPYEMICVGHVHHPLFTQVNSGVKVIINGCLIGNDSFSLGLGIQSSHPVQLLWETTKKYVQGDTRLIYVKDADTKMKYEKIIPSYTHELVASKTI